MAVAKKKKRRKKPEPKSLGLAVKEILNQACPAVVERLVSQIESDGGVVIGRYREPMKGQWQVLAALPVEWVKPTSFQRDLSEAHVKRLGDKIEKLNRYLDPITVVRSETGEYLTPNGHHRTAAMQRLGAKTIIALVIPEFEIAYQILALNTEKAYNLREKAIEAIRLARQLTEWSPTASEADYANEFEEPSFLTLGACYERKGNFSGGAYNPVLKKTEAFSDDKIARSLRGREERADRLLRLDEKVAKMVEKLKAQGLKSPYLKMFVIARINPLRFSKEKTADFDKTLDRMDSALTKINPEKIQPHHLASMAGAPLEENIS